MATVVRPLSKDDEDVQGEGLDPRICIELEKLNKSSDDINRLEVELDEARSLFRQVLTESTQHLNALAKKLGSCIDKARPYYDARINAKEAQVRTQNAALRFERACSQLSAAKEMVNLAEQGYFKMGQPFDPAWQEMLNHSTMKVNDAERERLESEVEHQRIAQDFNDAEQLVKKLQKDWKRNITKSRPYFEMKAKVNQQMEEQKNKVAELETLVVKAKAFYAETLHSLEGISDEIHQKRREARHRRKRLLKQNGGGSVIYHPLMNSSESSEEEVFIDLVPPAKGEAKGTAITECQALNDPLNVLSGGFPVSRNSPQRSNLPAKDKCVLPSTASKGLDFKPERINGVAALEERPVKKDIVSRQVVSLTTTLCSPRMLFGIPGALPESDPDQIRCNAEIMASISRSKASRPYLRPNRSHDDFLGDGNSETESAASSFASATMLGDEQIESLMLETAAYHEFLAKMDSSECDHFNRMSLPCKLSYLKNYVTFEPIWVDEQDTMSRSPSDPGDLDSSAGLEEIVDSADMVEVQRCLLERVGADVADISISKTHYV